MIQPSDLEHFVSQWYPVITTGGFATVVTAFHRRILFWARPRWVAFWEPQRIVADNERLSRLLTERDEQLKEARESAAYWKGSHEEIDARYDDLSARFEELRVHAQSIQTASVEALAQIENLRKTAEARDGAFRDAVADCDALLGWADRLVAAIQSAALAVDETLLVRPTLRLAAGARVVKSRKS